MLIDDKKFILASASPRRKELFSLVANQFDIVVPRVEEKIPDGMRAQLCPEYLAKIKAEAVARDYHDHIVVGADTAVILQDQILGKPKDRNSAIDMLKLLSGKTHRVITGCAVCVKGKLHTFSSITEVEFYTLNINEIEAYVNTSEPYDKAGAYGIQGLGSLFVKSIRGDYFNVVGLPVAELSRFIKKHS